MKAISLNIAVLVTVVLIITGGCGAKHQFDYAEQLETEGKYREALMHYKGVIENYPSSEYASFATYAVANIYMNKQRNYHLAEEYYRRIVDSSTDDLLDDLMHTYAKRALIRLEQPIDVDTGVVRKCVECEKILERKINKIKVKRKEMAKYTIVEIHEGICLSCWKARERKELISEIRNAAESWRSAKNRYYELEYELKYTTISSEMRKKETEFLAFLEYQFRPTNEYFYYASKKYIRKYGNEEFRDLAIKYDFLDLLK